MSDQLVNAVLATALGLVLAVLLLLPTAVVQYRRDGRLGAGDLATLVGAAVYALALWTYTLLPFPVDESFQCRRSRLDVMESVDPLVRRGLLPLSDLLHQAAFQQLALNLLLFVPLGFLVRLVMHRGPVVATLLGLTVSLAIEVTQLTGVWGLYRCAYRVFDVSDLLTNTLGAALGAVLAWTLLRPDRRTPDALPTVITLGRRWVGFACDVIFLLVLGATVALGWRAFEHYARGVPLRGIDDQVTVALQLAVPLAVEAAMVLLAGRTVGEWAISVRTVRSAGGVLPTPLARLVKLVCGVGGFGCLAVLGAWGSGSLLVGFVVLTLAASVRSRGHRGLAQWAAGLDLEITR